MYDNVYNDICNYYGYFSADGTQHDCGRGFELKKVSKNIEYNTYTDTLSTLCFQNRETVDLPRNHLDKKYIGELQAKGFDVYQSNFDTFIKALQNAENEYEENNKLCYNHTHVGWQDVDIGGTKERLYKAHGCIGDYQSNYNGHLEIKPKGKVQGQIDLIKREVIGHVPLEAILAIGASAIINGYIGKKVNAPTLIIHLVGKSSKGKTTAAQLAVSLAGCPDKHKSGLFMSWNGTYNAIVGRMKGNFGMPVAFDEISKYLGKDMSPVVYTLSDGREKDRCDKEANIKKIEEFDSWQTTIISTGESSLLGKCSNNTGLEMRVLELDDEFTKSAQNADNIKKGVHEHYGYIAPILAKKISQMGEDTLIKRHQKYVDMFIGLCDEGINLVERLANSIAIILLAADMLNTFFKLSLNISDMAQYFVDKIKCNNDDRDLADKAIEKIKETVNANKAKFVTYQAGREIDSKSNECWGKIVDIKHIRNNNPDIIGQYLICYERFLSILKDLNFEDGKEVIKELKRKGYLDCEKDKNYRKRKIRNSDMSASKVIVVNVFKDEEDESYEQIEDEDISRSRKASQKTSFDEYIGTYDEALPDFLFEEDEEDGDEAVD